MGEGGEGGGGGGSLSALIIEHQNAESCGQLFSQRVRQVRSVSPCYRQLVQVRESLTHGVLSALSSSFNLPCAVVSFHFHKCPDCGNACTFLLQAPAVRRKLLWAPSFVGLRKEVSDGCSDISVSDLVTATCLSRRFSSVPICGTLIQIRNSLPTFSYRVRFPLQAARALQAVPPTAHDPVRRVQSIRGLAWYAGLATSSQAL